MSKNAKTDAGEALKAPQTRAAEHIFGALKAKILSRELVRGNKLPTERALMAAYGVSISTVREAIRALAMCQFIEVRHGSGAYVTADTDELISTSLGSTMQIDQLNVSQVLSVYRALNVLAVELAAQNATSADLAEMHLALEEVQRAKNSPAISAGLSRFSNAIATASKNPLLAALCRSLAEVQFALAEELTGASYKLRRQVTVQLSQYRQDVVAAINDRDVVAAHAAALAYHHRTAEAIMSLPRTSPSEPGTSALSSLLASLLRR
jgi:GntR family transcriptional repressor for pyruvate dehydrogenase complex